MRRVPKTLLASVSSEARLAALLFPALLRVCDVLTTHPSHAEQAMMLVSP